MRLPYRRNLSAEMTERSRLVCDRLSAIYAGWTRSIETCVREAQRAGDIRDDIPRPGLPRSWSTHGKALRRRVRQGRCGAAPAAIFAGPDNYVN
jgi:TetR/AcrR family transcriptional repressor of nem operon